MQNIPNEILLQIINWLVGLSLFLLVGCGGFIVYIFTELKKSNNDEHDKIREDNDDEHTEIKENLCRFRTELRDDIKRIHNRLDEHLEVSHE